MTQKRAKNIGVRDDDLPVHKHGAVPSAWQKHGRKTNDAIIVTVLHVASTNTRYMIRLLRYRRGWHKRVYAGCNYWMTRRTRGSCLLAGVCDELKSLNRNRRVQNWERLGEAGGERWTEGGRRGEEKE